MSIHLVPVSEGIYERLNAEAARLQISPEQLIERLLTGEPSQQFVAGDEQDRSVPPAGSDEALAALQRLTTLFADVAIPDLDQVLADPAIAMANADVTSPRHDS